MTYHEDRIKKRSLTEEDIVFLMSLQKELNTQDSLCQADPRFWVIRGSDIEYGNADGDPVIIVNGDTEYSSFSELAPYLEHIAKDVYDDTAHVEAEDFTLSGGYASIYIKDEDGDEDECNTFLDFEDVAEWLEENGENISLTTKERRAVIYPDTFFMTNKAAHEHLKKNYYHYSDDAHTYAMTAWRSPEVEQLWKILQEIDWVSCKNQHPDRRDKNV